MAENQKSIFIRFNMDDKADRELYRKLIGGSGESVSLTAHVKRLLGEYFTRNDIMEDRQVFYERMIGSVREEMQSQGMKLAGALLAGIGSASLSVPQTETGQKTAELPDICEKLPEELGSILEFIG